MIDDDNLSLKIAKAMIRMADRDIPVITYASAREALAYLGDNIQALKEQITIVFLDIHLDEMDAWYFMEEVRKFVPDFNHYFVTHILTASIQPQDVERATLHPSIASYIEKPLSVAKLQRLLEAP